MDEVVFDRDTATRVVRAAKLVESAQLGGGFGALANSANQCITAKITSQDGTDKSKFAWQQERRTSSGWEVVTNGLTGTTSVRSAYQLDSASTVDLTNKHVVLARQPFKGVDTKIVLAWIILGVVTGSTSSPKVLSGSGTTADTGTWNRDTDKDAVQLDVAVRDYWDGSGNKLYYFTRTFTWDSLGDLFSIGAETQHTTDSAVSCT